MLIKSGILFFSMSVWSMTTLSHINLFLGPNIGVSILGYKKIQFIGGNPRYIKQMGIAPEFLLGYHFSRFIDSQIGVIYCYRPKFSQYSSDSNQADDVRQNLILFAAKFNIPIYLEMTISPELGIGYVTRTELNVRNRQTYLPAVQFWEPVLGVAAAYHFNSHWEIMTSWTYTPKSNSHQIPTLNFIGLGFIYSF